ncbi:MAG: helicase-related protein [Oleiphilaceae bacterium]|nr:helicase-related protein [Oleiphilaceae bacterium]
MTDSLPIDQIRDRVRQVLPHRHLVLSAATGSGKSTRLPLWALQQGPVLVVEPRRVACTALASYLAHCDDSPLGERIGYAIRFDACYRSDTPLVFVTPGIALRWLSEGRLERFHSILIDEFHERRWDTDLLLALLRRQDRHRLLLTSATLDAGALGHYLGAEPLHAEGRNYPVQVRYQATDDQSLPAMKGLREAVVKGVRSALAQSGGDVLVFLPGRGEIQQMTQALQGLEVPLLPLHGGSTSAEQKQVLSGSGGERRVILATNVAETSLTIPSVQAVVDSGLERRTHQRNGRTVLSLVRIARTSAEQRKGRAGRTGPGLCLRLWGEHAPLEERTPPQIQREELTELVLAAACAGVPAAELAFPDPLPEKALTQARERLEAMQALDDRGLATDHGRALFALPLDTLYAHLITAMPDADCRDAMIDLSAALSTRPRLLTLPEGEPARQALQQWQPLPCDATTLVQALRQTPPPELPFSATARREARALSRQIRRTLSPVTGDKSGDSIPQQPLDEPSRERWLQAIIDAAPELAYVRRSRRRHSMGNDRSELSPADHSRLAEDQEAALALDEYHKAGPRGHKQTLTLGTCLAPVPLQWLARAGLGQVSLAEATLEQGLPVVTEERHYAGRVIASETRTPCGERLREALCQLILQGRLLAPAGEQLREDLAQWQLYVTLEGLEEPTPEADPWLLQRLATLGVEEAADADLLEPGDLRFAGIPEWQREAFDRQYPRRLSLGDLKLAVYYHPAARRITLEKRAGERKAQPRRWELPSWTGWRVRYRQNSRVVDIH